MFHARPLGKNVRLIRIPVFHDRVEVGECLVALLDGHVDPRAGRNALPDTFRLIADGGFKRVNLLSQVDYEVSR